MHLLQIHANSEVFPVPSFIIYDVIMTLLLLLRKINVLANFIILSDTFLFMLFSLYKLYIFGANNDEIWVRPTHLNI